MKRLRVDMRRSGFSLMEILVSLTIMVIASGFVAYTYVSIQNASRLAAGATTLRSVFQLARQAAVANSAARRVVIETRSDASGGFFPGPPQVFLWIERKVDDSRPYWNQEHGYPDSFHNYRMVDESGDRLQLPLRIVVVDVNGRRVFNPQLADDRSDFYDISAHAAAFQRFYVVFNERGNVETAYAHQDFMRLGSYQDIVGYQQNRFMNLAFHIAEVTTEFDMNFDRVPETPYITSVPLSAEFYGMQHQIPSGLPNPHPLQFEYRPANDPAVISERQKVATVYLLSLTGRSMVLEYGRWYPFSSRELF